MRFLIVDDHAVVRRGTMEILSDYSDDVTFHEAGSSGEALSLLGQFAFDLVLLDISLPDENGLETLKKIRRVHPALPVLILSMHPEEEYAIRTFRSGANGYLAKNSAPEELITAVKKVLQGGKYLSPDLSDRLLHEYIDPKAVRRPSEQLSQREYQILSALAAGKTLTAIAAEMSLSVKTVSTYRARVMKKLKLANNAQLIRYAMQNAIA